jgi:hypothetical protein
MSYIESSHFILSQNSFSCCFSLSFHIHFRIIWSTCTKILAGILIRIC